MLEAYDTQLETVVSADEAAINGDVGCYRYACVCCGEDVYIAAAGSSSVVAHFRHNNGNNDTKCERYLGGCGQRSHEKATNGINVEFYFDELQKTFQMSIAFSEHALQEHEKIGSRLHLSNKTETSYGGSTTVQSPFYEIFISNNTFSPNVQKRIILSRFSRDYVLWNDININEKTVPCFQEQGKLTAFKILNTGSDYITAKLVKRKVLYTGVRYFVVSYSKYNNGQRFDVPESVTSEKDIKFSTMGRNFFGRIITIDNTSIKANSWCNNAGYNLAQSEQFVILWPPMATVDDVQITDSSEVFAFSSFNLKPRGNIKIRSDEIVKIDDYCYKLSIKNRVKIFHNNVEAILEQREEIILLDKVEQTTLRADKTVIDSDARYFSFSCDGVAELASGMKYLLFGDRCVRGYRANYPVKYFIPLEEKEKSLEEVIEDVIKVYHSTESYNQSYVSTGKLSPIAEGIISESNKIGQINSAVKRLIEGGRV